MTHFQPPAQSWNTEVAQIADLHSVRQISYDESDRDDESDDLFNFGSADGKPPISHNQTEFSLKQYAK